MFYYILLPAPRQYMVKDISSSGHWARAWLSCAGKKHGYENAQGQYNCDNGNGLGMGMHHPIASPASFMPVNTRIMEIPYFT